jgi:hypothetical protein
MWAPGEAALMRFIEGIRSSDLPNGDASSASIEPASNLML